MKMKCFYCGMENITERVKMYCDSGSNFPLRAHYKNPKKSVLRPYLPEYFYADICNDCGTVVRLYSPNTHTDWETGEY
jgi:hypothetical protein